MIKFRHLREKISKNMPKGDHVFDKKINGVTLMIHKDKGKFVTYIDNEKLDTYLTQREAEKMGREFIKQAGAIK